MGWQRLDNGELLNKAAGRFDAFVTNGQKHAVTAGP
jgi:hypothetical protein